MNYPSNCMYLKPKIGWWHSESHMFLHHEQYKEELAQLEILNQEDNVVSLKHGGMLLMIAIHLRRKFFTRGFEAWIG